MPDAAARDAETARLIVTWAGQFRIGCSIAGPHALGSERDPTLRDPADCPECVATFLTAVRGVLRDADEAEAG